MNSFSVQPGGQEVLEPLEKISQYGGGGFNLHSPCAPAGVKPGGRGYHYLLLGSLALVPPAMEVRTISLLLQPWNVLSSSVS